MIFLTARLAPLPASSQDLKDLYEQYKQHRQAGRYGEAARFAKQALDKCEARLGRNSPDCTWALNNLSDVYQHKGQAPAA